MCRAAAAGAIKWPIQTDPFVRKSWLILQNGVGGSLKQKTKKYEIF
jgi:hypothetical protein